MARTKDRARITDSQRLPRISRLDRVRQLSRSLLRSLSPSLGYHCADHTLHPKKGVAAMADLYCRMEGISDAERELVVAAAYLHDTGFLERYAHNEPIGARIAWECLPSLGYDAAEVATVQRIILATDPKAVPKDRRERIIRDADMDNLGREDFFGMSEALRAELGKPLDLAWYKRLVELVASHTYHTESARRLRDAGKARNLAILKQDYAKIPH